MEDSSGERPDRGRLLYLGSEILEAPVTEDSLGATTERFSDTWRQVGESCAADRFEPSTGPLCDWCPYVVRGDEGRLEVEQRVAAGRRRADAPGRALLGL